MLSVLLRGRELAFSLKFTIPLISHAVNRPSFVTVLISGAPVLILVPSHTQVLLAVQCSCLSVHRGRKEALKLKLTDAQRIQKDPETAAALL